MSPQENNQAEKIFKEAETGMKLGLGIATAGTVGFFGMMALAPSEYKPLALVCLFPTLAGIVWGMLAYRIAKEAAEHIK